MAPIAQFSGLASGIDSTKLIDAIIAARETTNQIRRDNISHIQSENDAFDDLNTKLLNLNSLIDKFRTVNNGGVSKKAISSDATIATATAGASASNTSFVVTSVTSIANVATVSFNDVYASLSSPLAPNAVGTVTIGVDVGTGANLKSIDIGITSATTIDQYVSAFNAHANAIGNIVATEVNVGTTSSPSYRVVFTSLKSGTDLGTVAFDIPGSGSFGGQNDLQSRDTSRQATNAVFTLSGISSSITRSTNSISDVLPGVTLNLFKTGTNTTISIGDDADATSDDVEAIVTAFNDIVKFIGQNDTITRNTSSSSSGAVGSLGATNIFGSLAKTRVDNDFLSQFRDTLAAASSTSGGAVTSFADLGLSTNRDGTITFDSVKFKTAVGTDSNGAAQVLRSFADSATGFQGTLTQFTQIFGFIDTAQNSNNDQITNLTQQIDDLERQSAKIRESLVRQFAKLESITAGLQSQQAALTASLSALGV